MAEKILVFHTGYGCETGCCGHTVALFDTKEFDNEDFDPRWYDPINDRESNRNFEFEHPDGNTEEAKLEFAKEMVTWTYGEEHVKDLDWEHSLIIGDCDGY